MIPPNMLSRRATVAILTEIVEVLYEIDREWDTEILSEIDEIMSRYHLTPGQRPMPRHEEEA